MSTQTKISHIIALWAKYILGSAWIIWKDARYKGRVLRLLNFSLTYDVAVFVCKSKNILFSLDLYYFWYPWWTALHEWFSAEFGDFKIWTVGHLDGILSKFVFFVLVVKCFLMMSPTNLIVPLSLLLVLDFVTTGIIWKVLIISVFPDNSNEFKRQRRN